MLNHRKRLLAFLFLAVFSLRPTSGSGAIYLPEVLHSDQISQSPFVYNGIVWVEGRDYIFVGSGYVVLPHALLTAAHLIFDDENLVWETNIFWNWKHHSPYPPSRGTRMTSQVWTSYAARVRIDDSPPEFSNLTTFNADTAALYSFSSLAGGSGAGGMKPSSAASNPYLTGNGRKMLVGYPLEEAFIPPENLHLMHRTPPGDYRFNKDPNLLSDSFNWPWRLYASPSVITYSGNSGGPLYVLFEDGRWFPVATFVASDNDIFVRAIDEDVAALVDLADKAAGGKGWNNEPVILQKSDNQSVLKGESVVLRILATGQPPLSYQWSKDGLLIPEALSDTLTLPPVDFEDAGVYSVTITNALGAEESADFSLKVNEPVVILQQPMSQTVKVGAEASFSVLVSGTPPLQFRWHQNGSPKLNGYQRVLTFPFVYTLDAGVYTVEIKNDVSIIVSEGAELIVDNLAPVLDNSKIPMFPAIDEDVTDNPGISVSELIGLLGGSGITDGDGDILGIAVVGLDISSGVWQYLESGSPAWTFFQPLSSENAFLLDPDSKIRFVPNKDFNGLIAKGLEFRAWDRTDGYSGRNVDTRTNNGGFYSFSAATAWAGILVRPVNDPPVLERNNELAVEINRSGIIDDSLLNLMDIDTDTDNLIYRLESLPALGNLLRNGKIIDKGDAFTQFEVKTGLITYSPFPNQIGFDAFKISFRERSGEEVDDFSFEVQIGAPVLLAKVDSIDGVLSLLLRPSIAVDKNTLVIGIRDADIRKNGKFFEGVGAVFILVRNQEKRDTWVHAMSLFPDDPIDYANFGVSLDLFGDILVVGADNAEGKSVKAGAVYVFERDPRNDKSWRQTAKIFDENGKSGDLFGRSVSLFERTLVVSAKKIKSNDPNMANNVREGFVQIFELTDPLTHQWNIIAELTGQSETPSFHFGDFLRIFEDTTVVSATDYADSGIVHIYERNANGPNHWGKIKELSSGLNEDGFGDGLGLFMDTLAVGAPYDSSVVSHGGVVYLYDRNFGGKDNWGRVQDALLPLDNRKEDYFGKFLALEKDILTVGSGRSPDLNAEKVQPAYTFTKSIEEGAIRWRQSGKLEIPYSVGSSSKGYSIAMTGRTIGVSYSRGVVLFGPSSDIGVTPQIGGKRFEPSSDWFFSPWFGFYNTRSEPWIYHARHGFLYLQPESAPDSLFLYDPVMRNWFWTSEAAYPNLFIFGGMGWVFFFDETADPRVFFQYSTGQFLQFELSN